MNRAKILLKEFFWGFGKTTSVFHRRCRLVNRCIQLLGLAYVALAFYPQALFAHSYTYENYTLHAHTPLPPETEAVLRRADQLLQESDLFSRDRHHHIFLCDDSRLFNLFVLHDIRSAYAYTPATRRIFLQHGSVQDDLCWKSINPRAVRSMSSLVAHEVTHNLVRERLGTIGAYRLATWKNEGYAEYVSMHGHEAYERQLVKDRPGFRPGQVSTRYRPYLDRILQAAEDDTAITFEDVLHFK